MAQHDMPLARAKRYCALNILALLDRKRLGADDARRACPAGQTNNQNDIPHTVAQNGGQHHAERQPRQNEEKVRYTHQKRIDPAADIARHDADERSKHHGDHRGHHAHEQRCARTAHEIRQNIAPLVVRSQPMRSGRRIENIRTACGNIRGFKRQDHRPENGHQDKKQNNKHSDARHQIAVGLEEKFPSAAAVE